MKKSLTLTIDLKKLTYWSSVVTLGIILGISLQFVKAFVEPAGNPPAANVGAPINTSAVSQIKTGMITAGTLSSHQFCLDGNAPSGGCISTWPASSAPKMLYGEVNANGSIARGSGFTVTYNGTGKYKVVPSAPAAQQVIIVSNNSGANNTVAGAGCSSSSCSVYSYSNTNGFPQSYSDSSFSFLIMGL